MASRRYGRVTVETSNEDKIFFPRDGITKGELIDYYDQASEYMLPFLREHPLVMHRFPDGIGTEGFYQKQVGDYFPDWIDTITVTKEGGRQTLAVVNKRATLVYLANQACITPHVWLSRIDKLDHPDQLVFDLDPPSGGFAEMRQAARWCREILEELGLPAYAKLTGSRGMHVVTPLNRSAPFDEVRAFARELAAVLAARHPEHLTVEHRKNKRRGRLYLDTTRMSYAQTVVAPYAVRALPGAPVATPVEWDELGRSGLDARSYTIKNIFRRLSQRGDPWASMRRRACSLTKAQSALSTCRDESSDQ